MHYICVTLLLSLILFPACDQDASGDSTSTNEVTDSNEAKTTAPSSPDDLKLAGTLWVSSPSPISARGEVLLAHRFEFSSETEGKVRFTYYSSLARKLREECVYVSDNSAVFLRFSYRVEDGTIEFEFDKETAVREDGKQKLIDGKTTRDYFREVWVGKYQDAMLVDLENEVPGDAKITVNNDLRVLQRLDVLHRDKTHLVVRTAQNEVLSLTSNSE